MKTLVEAHFNSLIFIGTLLGSCIIAPIIAGVITNALGIQYHWINIIILCLLTLSIGMTWVIVFGKLLFNIATQDEVTI